MGRTKKQTETSRTTLNIELARAGLNQTQLAQKLATPSTTLSDWLRGAHPGPKDLLERIERALGLPVGALQAKEARHGR